MQTIIIEQNISKSEKNDSLLEYRPIEELYKLKPIREKKDFSKMQETNLMDQHTMRKIQMVDTKNQYLVIKKEVDESIQSVLDSASYINGKAVLQSSVSL